ncbi:MAG: alpha/beta hydrolase fold domain-containing protein [Anaerolineae bacterium]
MKPATAVIILLALLGLGCKLSASTAPPTAETTVPSPTTSVQPATSNTQPESAFDPAKLGSTEKDVTYCTMDGVELKMDLYFPTHAESPFPATVYVHGGGWVSGDKTSGVGVRDIRELTNRGYLVVSLDYRLAPQYKFPAQIEDVKCAIRQLRAHAAAYGLDPDRIGVWGGSAGGHLVSLLGVTDENAGWDVGQYLDQSSRVQAVVDMFGPADLSLFQEDSNNLMKRAFGAETRMDAIIAAASPVTYVTSDDSPFLILHGTEDGVVSLEQSEVLYDALTTAGVPVELVIVENAGHGFIPVNGAINPNRQEITRMIADFFDQYLK